MKSETPARPGSGHEVTSWQARPFIIGAIGFFVLMALIFLIVGGLAKSWTHGVWPPKGPVAGPRLDPRWNVTAPQLQLNAPVDLSDLRDLEYQHLHTTRWTDENHTNATIPIEDAMSLMVGAEANHRLDQLLPAPKPATPVELQDQKSGDARVQPNSP